MINVSRILFPSIFFFPYAFYQAGIFFATAVLVVIAVFNLISYASLIEATAIQNSINCQKKDVIRTIQDEPELEDINELQNEESQKNVKVLKADYNVIPEERQDYYYIARKYEINELIELTFGKKEHAFVRFLLICFFTLVIALITRFISSTLTYTIMKAKNGREGKSFSSDLQVVLTLITFVLSPVFSLIKPKQIKKITYVLSYIFISSIVIVFISILLQTHLMQHTPCF